MRKIITFILLLISSSMLLAREPLYVVNGCVVESIESIPHEDIESIDVLPANEETIAEWGDAAGEGVILVRLRYDTPARFMADGEANFSNYLASVVKWGDGMEVARVSLRITIGIDGRATVTEILQSTSRPFLKRVERAIAAAPRWTPAIRDGEAIESTHLVNLQLPEGRELPVERGIILL